MKNIEKIRRKLENLRGRTLEEIHHDFAQEIGSGEVTISNGLGSVGGPNPFPTRTDSHLVGFKEENGCIKMTFKRKSDGLQSTARIRFSE